MIRPSRASLAVLGVVALLLWPGCGGGGSGPTGPSAPAVPVAVSPASGAVVDNATPTFVVENADGFGPGQAVYDFTVYDAGGTVVEEEIPGVPAGSGRTQATATRPLQSGGAYQWKAVARAGGRSVTSNLTAFQVGVACGASTDIYAKAVTGSFATQCTKRTNLARVLDPQSVLGAPDAHGMSDKTYGGFFSLGQDGWVEVDMGACIADEPGNDVRVYQYIEHETVTVLVSGSPNGPWRPIGSKACGDGGVLVKSHNCDFDLEGSGLKVARYVRIEDGENFPCDQAGTRTEGADIDAVEILHLKTPAATSK